MTITAKLFSVVVLASFFAVACNTEQASKDSAVKDKKAEPKGETAKEIQNGFDGMPPKGTKAFCPVMKNEFEVSDKTEHSVHEGKTYVFCCPGCKEPFEKEPEKYI